MAQLPIQRLTLYKQGIGYFERQGRLDEHEITLIVPRESTNDVLKSLDVTLGAAGQVLSVDYETPEDKAAQLAALPVRLGDRASLVDLLAGLRGAAVTLSRADDTHVAGRILGLEASLEQTAQPASVLLQREDTIEVIPIAQLRALTLHDPQAARDVSFVLDVSQTEQTRTTLTVRLSPGSHDVTIRYLAPSPTWRVSYRLVRVNDQQARLVGWGLFDNTLDEDLDNVRLTLISGRPISFEYELYQSRIPHRPHVSDEPIAQESTGSDREFRQSVSTLSHELRSPISSMTGFADLLFQGAAGPLTDQQREFVKTIRDNAKRLLEMVQRLLDVSRSQLSDRGYELPSLFYRSGPLGDLKVSGSYFMPVMMGNAEQEYLTYPVETPVSVRRGQSALVPIINATLNYEQLYVYNEAKMANHPLIVWRIRNTTGVALEQGPVTIVAERGYGGEGLMRFTGVGDELQVPFALEFGILVTQERQTMPRELWALSFDAEKHIAKVSWAHLTEDHYQVTSRTTRDLAIFIERRELQHGEYIDMPAGTAQDGHIRWSVAVPGQTSVTFTVRERHVTTAHERVQDWTPEQVENLRAANLLNETSDELLQGLLASKQTLEEVVAQTKKLQTDYQELVARQEQLRKNLGALGTSEREMALRNRILDDLEASEDRRRAIEVALAEQEQQATQEQDRQQTLVDHLFTATERNAS